MSTIKNLQRAVPIWEWIRDLSAVIGIVSFLFKTIQRLRRDSGLLQLLMDSTILGVVGVVSFLLVTSSGAAAITVAPAVPTLPYETHSTETWIASASIFGQGSSSGNPTALLCAVILMVLAYHSIRIASARSVQLMDLLRARKSGLLHHR